MLGLRIHPVNERTSFNLPSNHKAWSIFPRTKHFSTAMLKQHGPSLGEKVLERWEVSKEYFLEYLRKQKGFEKGAAHNERYKRISTLFKEKTSFLFQIAFLIDATIPFQKFLTTLQFEGPLIHILFKELKSLLKSIMLIFSDPKIIEGESGADLAKIVVDSQENRLSLDKIVVGAKSERFLKKLSPEEREERELQ